MKKLWQDDAWKEYLYWQTQDKKTLRKINFFKTQEKEWLISQPL